MRRLKLALLDMYAGEKNQGMRAINEILGSFDFEVKIFDVRGVEDIPDLSYDIYISTGGPGNPLEKEGSWGPKWNGLIADLWEYNKKASQKKFVFFICHSFQLACDYFKIGEINLRYKKSFGTYKCHQTAAGLCDPIFSHLDDPFWIADFRFYQVIQPDMLRLEELGAEILALEKIRPNVNRERAIMAIRFSNEFFGTQFHPEADPIGMMSHFENPKEKAQLIELIGEERYLRMLNHLSDPDKISVTYSVVIHGFLKNAVQQLSSGVLEMA